MQYVRSNNDTYHIPLHNHNNKFCHHIAVIQRIHTSQTLNRLLRNLVDNHAEGTIFPDIRSICDSKLVNDTVLPLLIYALYDKIIDEKQHNIVDVNIALYDKFKVYYEKFVDEYVSEKGRDGYFSRYDLYFLFMPCIYELFPDDFVGILCELHCDLFNFNREESTVNDIIKGQEGFLKEEYVEEMYDLYMNMVRNLPEKIHKRDFCSAVLEVHPNSGVYGAHAIVMILGKDGTFYIIDDSNSIFTLEGYYSDRQEKVYSISIRDIDSNTIAKINAILHAKCEMMEDVRFSERMSRYELNFDHKFENVDEQKILKEEFHEDIDVDGGIGKIVNFSSNNTKSIFRIAFMLGFLCCLLIASIVLSIIHCCMQPKKKPEKHVKFLL